MDEAKTTRGHLQKEASLIQPVCVLPVNTMLSGSERKTLAIKGEQTSDDHSWIQIVIATRWELN